jgi:hypothetical protein
MRMENDMIRAVIAVALLLGVMLEVQASPANQGPVCVAKVLKSEELPYAPVGYWLVRVTLEITSPSGLTFEITRQDMMPWQGPPPRRGQTFRLLCDPANPSNLHLI